MSNRFNKQLCVFRSIATQARSPTHLGQTHFAWTIGFVCRHNSHSPRAPLNHKTEQQGSTFLQKVVASYQHQEGSGSGFVVVVFKRIKWAFHNGESLPVENRPFANKATKQPIVSLGFLLGYIMVISCNELRMLNGKNKLWYPCTGLNKKCTAGWHGRLWQPLHEDNGIWEQVCKCCSKCMLLRWD